METNGKNRFASQGVSIAQMMYVSKYKSHKIALFNSMKKSNIAPISGSDVTIVALKLAMNSHFPLPKIRTSRFSLHTSRLSLHGEVTIVALKIAMSSHFPLPNFFSPSLFPLFQMAQAARRVIENPRQMIKSYPVLFCSSHRKNESN